MKMFKTKTKKTQVQAKEFTLLRSAEKIVLIGMVLSLSVCWGMAIYFWAVFPLQESSYIANPGAVNFTEAVCARMQNNPISQGECYMKVAKSTRNERVCGNIRVAEMEGLCFVELAETKRDESICRDEAVSDSLRSVCADYFAVRR